MNLPAEGLFELWNAYPDLLPAVEPDANRESMIARVESHPPCCHCGEPSEHVMMAVHNRGGRRWVDLCLDCRDWVREGIERMRTKAEWRERQEADKAAWRELQEGDE